MDSAGRQQAPSGTAVSLLRGDTRLARDCVTGQAGRKLGPWSPYGEAVTRFLKPLRAARSIGVFRDQENFDAVLGCEHRGQATLRGAIPQHELKDSRVAVLFVDSGLNACYHS